MKVRFFGRLADHAGRELVLAADCGETVSTVRELIARSHPALGQALTEAGVRACVGHDFLDGNHVLHDDDLLEFWPPVSGG